MNIPYSTLLDQVREKNPLVHHITNYVTVNDCANVTLAVGASPIMSDAIEEVQDITSMSSALVLNIGTLNNHTVDSMVLAGQTANKNRIPVILDPVGVGASKMRNEAVKHLLKEVRISVLCGNASEIGFLAGLRSNIKGVDASNNDLQKKEETNLIIKQLASRLKCIVAITGAVDILSDGEKIVCIQNGHPKLSSLTGTGCMCTSLIGSFCGVGSSNILKTTAMAVSIMGIAGEIAFEKVGEFGNGTFHTALQDAISLMSPETIKQRIHLYEI